MAQQKVDRGKLTKAARIVLKSNYVIALTGAGISTRSGIPTFRGPGGLWNDLDSAKNILDYNYFAADPERWWYEVFDRFGSFWSGFVGSLQNAQPNKAHIALADLEKRGVLKYLITQNIDNLHQNAGSRGVGELHGSFLKLRCLNCNSRFPITDFFDQKQSQVIPKELPPRCTRCNTVLKCDAVLFNEAIPNEVLNECLAHLENSDCVLVVGTSGIIRPAAEFPARAKDNGATLIEINPTQTPLTPICDIILQYPADTILPLFVREIERLQRK